MNKENLVSSEKKEKKRREIEEKEEEEEEGQPSDVSFMPTLAVEATGGAHVRTT